MNTSLNIALEYPQPTGALMRFPKKRTWLTKKSASSQEPRVTDRSILERIADGDNAAVKDCLDAYRGLIWSLARRFLGNGADAEDAVQDIFIAIWSAAGKYDRAIGNETTFISTIARRRLIDQLRKAGRRPATESLDSEDSDHPQLAVAGQLENSAEAEQVERVLDAMSPEIREVLSLSLHEGYTHSEIARRIDLPLGTVKSRARRGLMQVREQLQVAA